MKIRILPRYISVDGHGAKVEFDLSENIHAIWWNDDTGRIEYNDGTKQTILTKLSDIPSYNSLLLAYRKATPPSKYHIWNDTLGKWEFTAESQAQKDVDDAAAQELAELIAKKEAEKASNILSNITFEQAENHIDTNVKDLASAKEEMKLIVRLLLART